MCARAPRLAARTLVGADVEPQRWGGRGRSLGAAAGRETPPPFLALDRVWAAFDPEPSIAQAVFATFVTAGPSLAGPPPDPISWGSTPVPARRAAAPEPHPRAQEDNYCGRIAWPPPFQARIRL